MQKHRTPAELIVIAKPAPRPKGEGCEVPSVDGRVDDILRAHQLHSTPLREGQLGPSGFRKRSPDGARRPDGYRSLTGPKERLEAAASQLRGLSCVQAAYVRPGAELAGRYSPASALPVALPAAQLAGETPDFSDRQGHLDASPGVNARAAALRFGGALGANVQIVDVEWAWRFDHEDLRLRGRVEGGAPGQNFHHDDHGTSVLGVLVARRNKFGVDGMVPDARIGTVALPDFDGNPGSFSRPLAEVIRYAAGRLRRGDVLLLELQMPGPEANFTSNDDETGYIAPDWWPDVFLAVREATNDLGVVVVEAAGNGGVDLDSEIYGDEHREEYGFPGWWSNPFEGGANSSGAILVAAGNSEMQIPMTFSNVGSRIDANAWGDKVVTTGKGTLLNAGPTRKYALDFGGTSSAAAIVAGAIVAVQGARRYENKAPLTPSQVTALLRSTGTPPEGNYRIGNRPDVVQMIERALALP